MVTRGDNRRLVRVSGAIRGELAQLLVKEAGDPLLAWVTITDVEVSPDLRHARVFFAAAGADDIDQVERSLAKAAPFLQRELGTRMTLRYTPKLSFRRDSSFDRGERIEEIIREVRVEESERNEEESLYQRLGRLVSDAGRILVATHRNPDGDAIGSLLGMAGILRLMGKDCTAFCPDGIPKILTFLPGAENIALQLDESDSFDLTLLLDTADESLLPNGFPDAETRGLFVVIDHHRQHGDMGDLVIRMEAAAVGEILHDLATQLVWPIDADVAECLYTSIVADTGSFRYSSTQPSTHRAAAELLAVGARPWPVATHLYESFPHRRQRLLAKVLETLEVSEDGRFAQLYCTPEILTSAGAHKEDLDGMINFGRSVSGVEIAAMFRQEQDGDIKVSFRSKGRIDVGELATRFGGGGHRNASGCTLQNTDLATARKTIMKAAEEYLAAYNKQALSEPPS